MYRTSLPAMTCPRLMRQIGGTPAAALAIAGSLLIAGCSPKAGVDGPGSSGSGTSVRPIAAGAMTGAVIGSGLGAIIGSTSGDAGAGVAIGGASGALVGAGIGYQVEGQEKALALQQESIERQEQQIAAQRNEIDSLRSATRDPVLAPSGESAPPRGSSRVKPVSVSPSSGRGASGLSTFAPAQSPRASLGTASFGVQEGYRGNPRAKPYGQSEKRPAGWSTAASGATAARARKGASAVIPPPASVRLDPPVEHSRTASRQTGAAAGTGRAAPGTEQLIGGTGATADSGLPPAVESLPEDDVDLGGMEPDRVVEKSAAKESDGGSVRSASAKKAGSAGANCEQAAREAERGLNAGSTADRLFYLKRAAQLCPAEPTYHLELGRSYIEVGKKKDAVIEFRQAIDLDPDNQMARDELSMLENSAGGTTRQ